MTNPNIEYRRAVLGEQREGMILPITVEFRDEGDGAGPDYFTMTGQAATFNHMSEDLGGFKEIIKPGAFRSAARTSLIHLLWNHDSSRPLASTDSGTLRVNENEEGLGVWARIPRALSYAQDIRSLFGAGIARGMSFAFTMPSDGSGEEWSTMPDGTPLRTLTRVSELFDVSPVTRGAYTQPAFSMRSLLEARLALLDTQGSDTAVTDTTDTRGSDTAVGTLDTRGDDTAVQEAVRAAHRREAIRLSSAAAIALFPER